MEKVWKITKIHSGSREAWGRKQRMMEVLPAVNIFFPYSPRTKLSSLTLWVIPQGVVIFSLLVKSIMCCHTLHHWVADDGADHCIRHFPGLSVAWLWFTLNNISNEVGLEELGALGSRVSAAAMVKTDGLLVMYTSKILFSSCVLWNAICAHTDNIRQHIIPGSWRLLWCELINQSW